MKKNNDKKELMINCKVSAGMFSSERGVTIEIPDGRKFSALVDKSLVSVKEDPQPGQEIWGKVKVYIVEKKGDSVIIDLPQAGLTNGPRLKLLKQYLEPNGLLLR